MKGRTTLVIAHRLTTIEKADLILVMDQAHRVQAGVVTVLRHQLGMGAALDDLPWSITRIRSAFSMVVRR